MPPTLGNAKLPFLTAVSVWETLPGRTCMMTVRYGAVGMNELDGAVLLSGSGNVLLGQLETPQCTAFATAAVHPIC